MFYDTDGNSVQAHGMGIMQWQGLYYIYGESAKVCMGMGSSGNSELLSLLLMCKNDDDINLFCE